MSESTFHPAIGEQRFAVTVWDLGADRDVITALCERGCQVTCLPETASARDILLTNPDGIVIVGRDRDPFELTDLLPVFNELFGKRPILGVGLGHLLMALARDGKVDKLPAAHSGTDTPITAHQLKFTASQNHEYVVTEEPSGTLMLYRNANDRTCEGIYYTTRYCLTVQFDPNDIVLNRFFDSMIG